MGIGKRPRLQEHPRTQPSERALDSSRHAGMTLVPTPKRWKECARFSGLLQAIGMRQKAELPSGVTSLPMKVNYGKVQVEVYDWWERKLAAFQMTTLQVRYVTHRRIGSNLRSRLTTMAWLLSFEAHQETRLFAVIRLLAQLLESCPRALCVLRLSFGLRVGS